MASRSASRTGQPSRAPKPSTIATPAVATPTAPAPAAAPPAAPPATPLHRSGAVARMLRMPVATLRVWERRYALTQATLSSGGQRLYSPDDVRRLTVLKQLVERGHAIGRLAPLDLAQLQQVASTHAQSLAMPLAAPGAAPPARPRARSSAPRPWRLVVVGKALFDRLQRPALRRALGPSVDVRGPYADVPQAAAAEAGATGAQAWLLHAPQIQAGWADTVAAAVPPGVQRAVLYGFAADALCDALAARGLLLLREPQPDVVLAQWLRHAVGAVAQQATERALAFSPPAGAAAPRRWDDDALSDFAARSTTVACECPRHVAELLVLLSRFEVYSAQCEQRSAADAWLHAGLARVAAGARASFEAALEQVALHEGLPLPPAAA